MQTYAAAMADRPEPFTQLDRYFAAARIAHEYVGDIFQELVRLDRADAHAPELLAESAAIALRDIHELTRDARELERQWHEQELLNPQAAAQTLHAFDSALAGWFHSWRTCEHAKTRSPEPCADYSIGPRTANASASGKPRGRGLLVTVGERKT
jgi:hypothetical protein